MFRETDIICEEYYNYCVLQLEILAKIERVAILERNKIAIKRK